MGCGFLEHVYHECLMIEFEFQGIPFTSKPQLTLGYRDRTLVSHFEPDFVCFGQIIVEIKAVSKIIDDFRAKTLNYLHATKMPLALLVNFGHHPKLEYERLACTRH
jgi:GxxExxY protein